jgi:NAD(P)-dependent dehydrogenase (short-subunit alcohol dehydrogenase family)
MNNPQQYGPWALVTGASDGIGKVLATQIAAGGINVVLVARGEDKLHALASALHAEHGIDTSESRDLRTTRHQRLTSRAWPRDCTTNSPRGGSTCWRSRRGPSTPASAPERGSR